MKNFPLPCILLLCYIPLESMAKSREVSARWARCRTSCPIIHGPRGCGFHYRHSARRRHQPLYRVLTTNLEERDIIGGGEEKLRRTVEEAWRQYHPKLIMVIPSPISDILNDDILTIVQEMRGQGIPVVGIQSELFSHRDKNYTRNRLKKIAEQKITGENRLEMEIKGCGFVEALYALVGQVMEAVPGDPPQRKY